MLLPISGGHHRGDRRSRRHPQHRKDAGVLCVGRIAVFEDEGASRVRDLDLLVDREVERAAALGFDLGLVMGSSEIRATPSAAPPQPRRENHPAGRDPGAPRPLPNRHSNAPIKHESQSFLGK
jgi:hypothetical protein